MGNHSPVSGSGMHRWMMDSCPGSAAVIQHYPNLTSYAAEEGSAAHELAQLCYQKDMIADDLIDTTINDIVVDNEMAAHIANYVLYIRGLAMFTEHSECELTITHPDNSLIRGTIDHVAMDGFKTAYVTDLKYGFVPVPSSTPQLMYYAALVFFLYGKFQQYVLTIYQPRLFSRSESHVTRIVTQEELDTWIDAVLLPSITLAMSNDAPRKAGEWCRYCPAKLDCPELSENRAFLQPPFAQMTNEQITKELQLKSVNNSFYYDLEREATKRLLAGETVEGYKAVNSRTRGKIIDEVGFAKAMGSGDIYRSQLKTLAELRAIDNDVVEQFLVRPSGKTTVVPVNDSSSAVTTHSDNRS